MNKIENIFSSLRSEYLIIGLTGAVSSGCTESAKFLSAKNNDIDNYLDGKNTKGMAFQEKSRVNIMRNINKQNKWKDFYHIKVSNILFFLLIFSLKKKNKNEIVSTEIANKITLGDILKKDKDMSSIVTICTKLYKKIKNNDGSIAVPTKELLKDIDDFIAENIDKEKHKYTVLFQRIGSKIRKNGTIIDNINLMKVFKYSDIGDSPVLLLAKITREIIKLLDMENKHKHKFYVIDALRNIYEIEFFKNRYASFYLLSILADEQTREGRLLKDFKFKKSDIEELGNFEKYNTGVSAQAINACIGKGDIFIQNNSDINNLRYQLIKYIILIRNPGIFTPSDDERFMQLAFTARYNSGCISRQVGAVVSGKDGYIRGIGWNDVPEGHTPCIYRTAQELLFNSGESNKFSAYEKSEEFVSMLRPLKSKARSQPFCFKDIRNKIEKNKEISRLKRTISADKDSKDVNFKAIKDVVNKSKFKNPTRERALHAEENAFLQVSKSGGQSVAGGTLYTTDSPCQLCAKKAMQLKISRIVYIDAYPDISISHTLQAGTEKNDNPTFEMFNGAIGKAYFKLYIPIIGLKDMFKEVNQ
jgi:dCMP deaminase